MLSAFGIKVKAFPDKKSIRIIFMSLGIFSSLGLFLPSVALLAGKLYDDDFIFDPFSIFLLISSILSFLIMFVFIFFKRIIEISPSGLAFFSRIFSIIVKKKQISWNDIKGFSYMKTNFHQRSQGLKDGYDIKLIIDTVNGKIRKVFNNIPNKSRLGLNPDADREYMRSLIKLLTRYAVEIADVKKEYNNRLL